MVRKNGVEIDEKFFVDLGIENGVKEIIKNHPRFEGQENEIARYIDQPKLKSQVYDLYEAMEENNVPEKQRRNYIVKTLTDYISTGLAFNEKGKELFLFKGLEEKARSGVIKGWKARKMLKEESAFDKRMGWAYGLSRLMNSKDYARTMPEIAKAARELEKKAVLDKIVKEMYHGEALSAGEYRSWTNKIYNKTKGYEKTIKTGIEKYIAASVFGLLGIFLIAFSSRVTGAVIGGSKEFVGGITGIIFVIFSLILFLFLSIKKFRLHLHLKKNLKTHKTL